MAPELSVIIPVKDGAATLPPLLRSLAAQTLAPERFEVIVADNGSRDATAEVARAYGARVISDPAPNRSRARNSGAAAARGERFAFIDADCVADPGWLAGMAACAGLGDLIAGPVHINTGEPPNAIERWEALWRFDQRSWVAQGWAASANLTVVRRAFESVGGFDPAYRHIGEDADFCIRAIRAGFTLAYCDEAVVFHEAERQLMPLLRRSWRHGYSSNQTTHRIGVGFRAWRHPGPLLSSRRALALFEMDRLDLPPEERRRMGRLAQTSYAVRMIGSAWSEGRRIR